MGGQSGTAGAARAALCTAGLWGAGRFCFSTAFSNRGPSALAWVAVCGCGWPRQYFPCAGGEAELQRRAPSHSVPVKAAVSAVLFVA